VSSTEAAKEETEKAAAAALEAVLAAVSRHRQDLTLLEALDKASKAQRGYLTRGSAKAMQQPV